MTETEYTTFPDADRIFESLQAISDLPELGPFYLAIAAEAERVLSALDVALIFIRNVNTFFVELEAPAQTVMLQSVPAYIDALVGEKTVAMEAKNIYEGGLHP